MAKTEKQQEVKQKAPKKPRRSRAKETFSELKKVNWPTFGKTMKQTGMVLTIVAVFTLLVFALDLGVGALIKALIGIGK